MCLLQNLECNNDQISTTPYDLANIINQTFLEPMKAFDPLQSNFINRGTVENQSLCTSEFYVFKLLPNLNSNKASGPEGIPAWILKENAGILASPVSKILDLSYKEARLPSIWKHANIIPILKEKPVHEVNKHYDQYP